MHPPKFKEDAFDCPNCHTYAHMTWSTIKTAGGASIPKFGVAKCSRCTKHSIWLCETLHFIGEIPILGNSGNLVFPMTPISPLPHPELPESCKKDYLEARDVFPNSPRASAALLRLCIQKLCKELGREGRNINDDIAALVSEGLPVAIKETLDIIRVTGNNAVHPGEMSDYDTGEITSSMFELINFVVDNQIAQPKRIRALHDRLPAGAKDAIAKRDAKTHSPK